MTKYNVKLTEIRIKYMEIDADSEDEAKEKIEKDYLDFKINLIDKHVDDFKIDVWEE